MVFKMNSKQPSKSLKLSSIIQNRRPANQWFCRGGRIKELLLQREMQLNTEDRLALMMKWMPPTSWRVLAQTPIKLTNWPMVSGKVSRRDLSASMQGPLLASKGFLINFHHSRTRILKINTFKKDQSNELLHNLELLKPLKVSRSTCKKRPLCHLALNRTTAPSQLRVNSNKKAQSHNRSAKRCHSPSKLASHFSSN
jgi:hypothetical protein